MTKEQSVVVSFYFLCAAIFAGIVFHKFSVFFLVIFLLAGLLKLANSIEHNFEQLFAGKLYSNDHGTIPLKEANIPHGRGPIPPPPPNVIVKKGG